MNNLANLLLIEFKQNFKNQSKKKNINSNITLLSTFLLLLGIGIFISIFYTRIFLMAGGTPDITIYMVEGFVSYFIFNQLIIATKKVFIGKDYDMLESMPIKKSNIVIAKFLNLYLLGLYYSIPILGPSFGVAFYYTKDAWLIFSGIISVILTPMFPLVVAGFLATIFSLISAKSEKFSQSIDFIFNLLTIIAIVCISMFASMNSSSNGDVYNLDFMQNMIYINPTFFFVKESFKRKYFIIFYVLVCSLIFVLMASFVALLYRKIHILMCGSRVHNKYIRKELEVKNELSTLIRFEFKKLFGTKMYLLNTIIGGTLGIFIASIGSIAFRNYSLEQVETALGLDKLGVNAIIMFILILINYFLGIVVPSQGLVNLEGKQFYLLKSLPINPKNWVKAKLIVSYTISMSFSLIVSTILIAANFRFLTITSIIAIIICPLLFVLFENNILLLTNLRNPNFEWMDEQQLIKSCQQGLGVLLDIIGIIVDAGIIYLGFILSNLIFKSPNNYFSFGFYILFYLILNYVVIRILNKKTDEYFSRA